MMFLQLDYKSLKDSKKVESYIFAPLEILNIFRLDGFDESIAFEIFGVEGQ